LHLLHLLAAAGPSGEPTLKPGLDPNQVTPGPWGFFITFGLAVVVILLIWDMSRRIRRVRYREQMEQDAQHAAASGEQVAGASDGGGVPAASGRGEHRETQEERQRRLDRELNAKVTGRRDPGSPADDASGRRPSDDGPTGS
jgi:flagellar biosynthesis/type III secretory pathway M-ring protein FliF/YscJ